MAEKKKVAIVGYGTIGERIADAIVKQDDMELAGVVDVAASLPVRALVESGKGYPIYCALEGKLSDIKNSGIPVKGLMEDLLKEIDIVVDATSPGIGMKNKEIYVKHNVPAIFQAGEGHDVAENVLHPMANYDKCKGLKYVQMFSCNTMGIARQAFTCDRALGLREMVCMIVRRAADVSETHKGPVDALLPEKIPSHQAEDFAFVSPDIKVVTAVVTAPVCHGHATTMIFDVNKKTTKDEVMDMFRREPRIRLFRLEDGFISTSHIFDYCRDKGSPRGDMYEVPVWEETIYVDHDGLRVYSINMIPQEAIVIPENIDAVRCLLGLEETGNEAIAHTNRCLGIA
jgi:glyceraldehyde-3-phosphate dehydrogenase (NAD(P))